ncbi:MAG TPA: ABATE domain-containing protein [Longimicrobiales bacterium]
MRASSPTFLLVANRLCLDFVNTESQGGRERIDRIGSYPELVQWARKAGALDGGEADYVLERWPGGPEADAALEAARALRRRLRDVAEQLAAGTARISPEALDAINQALRGRPGYLQLERDGSEWAARWKVPLRRPEDVLWRVARSAASLLADDDLTLVRRCDRASCRLFFYDTTKNHRKRYCRMDVCGVAERAAAYLERRRSRS